MREKENYREAQYGTIQIISKELSLAYNFMSFGKCRKISE